MTKKPMIDVSARMFNAALVCVSNEETRFYLRGVFVQPHPEKGVLLVSTDGHRLFCAHDESGRCDEPAIIADNDGVSRVLDRATKNSAAARVTVSGDGIISVPDHYQGFNRAVIDGTFPDWPRVVPALLDGLKKKRAVHAAFNPRYIGDFAKCSARLSPKSNGSVRIIATEADAPVLVLFGVEDAAFALLMPMKQDIGDALPAFMRPVLEPPAAADRPTPRAPKKKAA